MYLTQKVISISLCSSSNHFQVKQRLLWNTQVHIMNRSPMHSTTRLYLYPLLIDDYGTNRVRKVKTDKKDSLKIASFAIDKWLDLREYIPANDIRKTLKILNRQYVQYNKILVMQKNNLISLLDSCFPNANTLFTSPR